MILEIIKSPNVKIKNARFITTTTPLQIIPQPISATCTYSFSKHAALLIKQL